MTDYPTEFLGAIWDAGWEFDAPCVIYYPIMRYGFGGNSGHLESMVEDYCIDLCLGIKPSADLSASVRKEFSWRGWNPRGVSHRKRAWHVRITVRWYTDQYGQQAFEIKKCSKTWGPPKRKHLV